MQKKFVLCLLCSLIVISTLSGCELIDNLYNKIFGRQDIPRGTLTVNISPELYSYLSENEFVYPIMVCASSPLIVAGLINGDIQNNMGPVGSEYYGAPNGGIFLSYYGSGSLSHEYDLEGAFLIDTQESKIDITDAITYSAFMNKLDPNYPCKILGFVTAWSSAKTITLNTQF